ncbi:MAG: FkbM family methyltransferase [Nanoarchaeota archaeon]|nr:FkbM family methyltransferase [Nanoarchaeota archaeon]
MKLITLIKKMNRFINLKYPLITRKIAKIYIIKHLYRFIVINFLKANTVKIDGHKLFLDSEDSLRLSVYGQFEAFETEVIKKEIKEGDVVLDIGANIGYYALIFAKLVGPKGKVFAFEPDPENFALLNKNIKINEYKNVVLINKAVSNETGEIKLYLNEYNKANHQIYPSKNHRKSILIQTTRLDDFFKDYKGKIDFVKIDIEGAEYLAIQGMSNLLNKNKNIKIITEFYPCWLENFNVKSEEYLKLLSKHGFKLYNLNKNAVKKTSIPDLSKVYTVRKENYTNLLCKKS